MRPLLTISTLLLTAVAAMADDAPLYQQEPYDTIKLDDDNRNAELRVLPLDLPDRIVPAKPKPDDELEIHLLDRPRKAFRLAWGNIVGVKLFEQRVLDEADRLVETKKLDEAFPYYEYLERRYPKMRGLDASYNKFLMASAVDSFKREKYDECLAISWELYARDPGRKGVATAVLRAADKLIERRFAEQDYDAARALLAQTAERLKDAADQLTASWTEKLKAKALELMSEAGTKLQAKDYANARRAAEQALAASPDVAGGKEAIAAVDKEYPEVVVGVTALASEAAPVESWAAQRDQSLTAGQGANGGSFRRASTDAKATRFTAPAGSSASAGQPREVVERLFANSAAALAALERGEITVVDRIDPWQAAALANSRQLVVEPYRTATLHLLIPNLRRPLLQTSVSRRAVAHAIDRFGILGDRFSRGRLPTGCEVVDRTLPVTSDDPTTDEVSASLRYDLGVAKLLAGYAVAENSSASGAGQGQTPGAKELVLAYPNDEVARLAAQAISEQMRVAGISVRLEEHAVDDAPSAYENADLIFVEWTSLDPLAELPRLIGRGGIGGDAGPIVERLLRDAQRGSGSKPAERMARLQSAIGDATLAIPLWKLNNYLVYLRELTGVGKRPVALYQDVEKWKLTENEGR
jgi:peptide/nickel transport system substrate-binding protein